MVGHMSTQEQGMLCYCLMFLVILSGLYLERKLQLQQGNFRAIKVSLVLVKTRGGALFRYTLIWNGTIIHDEYAFANAMSPSSE